jgi:hypothetical protein
MSNSVTPELKEFAGQLLAFEASSVKPADAKNSSAFRVCEKLGGPLGKLTGVRGFRSLLSRALALAGAEVPWLRGLHVQADGSLEGLAALEEDLDRSGIVLGETVLVAHLLGLLVTFIGSALTQGLVRDIWPKMEYMDL